MFFDDDDDSVPGACRRLSSSHVHLTKGSQDKGNCGANSAVGELATSPNSRSNGKSGIYLVPGPRSGGEVKVVTRTGLGSTRGTVGTVYRMSVCLHTGMRVK